MLWKLKFNSGSVSERISHFWRPSSHVFSTKSDEIKFSRYLHDQNYFLQKNASQSHQPAWRVMLWKALWCRVWGVCITSKCTAVHSFNQVYCIMYVDSIARRSFSHKRNRLIFTSKPTPCTGPVEVLQVQYRVLSKRVSIVDLRFYYSIWLLKYLSVFSAPLLRDWKGVPTLPKSIKFTVLNAT